MSINGPRKHGEDCVARAHNASSPLEKSLLLLMADAWMKLAHAAEKHGEEGSSPQQKGRRKRNRQLA
jgi:hypothetical protein